ncbi:hypothetical protein M2140_000081 [Clostridiales Family XIII bacterium PM5-7]
MITYKGTDMNMRCRGYQYELGKQEEIEGDVKLCGRGFHSCEDPIEVFFYYPPSDSRYFETKTDDISDETRMAKRVSKKIKFLKEIGINGIIEAGLSLRLKQTDFNEKNNTNERCFMAQENDSASVAYATGNYSSAQEIGNYSLAHTTGTFSSAQTTAPFSIAKAIGLCSGAQSVGISSVAQAIGNYTASQTISQQSVAQVTGDCSTAQTIGQQSLAQAIGKRVVAISCGNFSSASVKGEHSIACAFGYNCTAQGTLGNYLVLTERGEYDGECRPIKTVKVIQIDGEKYKENTLYQLVDGEVVPAIK